jgi:hypothetical protein
VTLAVADATVETALCIRPRNPACSERKSGAATPAVRLRRSALVDVHSTAQGAYHRGRHGTNGPRLAIFSAIATSRTHHLLAAHAAPAEALTSGFERALIAGSIFLRAASVIAARATNTRGQPAPSPEPRPVPDAA